MATTNYHTVNGEIIGETTSSVRTGYLTDGLGSVTATQGSTGNVLATYRYKPYGALLAKTGTGMDPRFLWTGSSGSRATSVSCAGNYNRARHYSALTALWTSADPLWPHTLAYVYAQCRPITATDPSGLFSAVYGTVCGIHNSLIVRTDRSDQWAISSGHGIKPKPIIDGPGAIEYCKSRAPKYSGRVLVVNGSLFAYASGLPHGPVGDCKGNWWPNGNDLNERARGEKFQFGLGYIWPRLLWKNKKCWADNVPSGTEFQPRTLIQKTANGPVFKVIPGIRFRVGLKAKQMCACFGEDHLHLDGGSSTQAWLQLGDGGRTGALISGVGFRLNNWIWMREKDLVTSWPVKEPD
ncbi:MAG: hypothetical protein IT363_11210 [Methanoregulaceae archaeon]|nr:hypothetical protein [Methanoregulaceae archaeon]